MKVLTTLALAAAALSIGVPLASAQPDALDRYLQANPPATVPDAIDRYRWNNEAPAASGPAMHPDSRGERFLRAGEPVVPDALDRYLWSNRAPSTNGAAGHPDSRSERFLRVGEPAVPDALDRYLWSNRAPSTTGAAGHPDSLAVRPTVVGEPVSFSEGGRDWETGALGAAVGLLIALMLGSTAVLRDRRRLAH